MRPHILLAHQFWEASLRPGDTVIDATVGNGHDTLVLAQLMQGKGRLVGYDIQQSALEQARTRLSQLPPELAQVVTLRLASHAQFLEENAALIVYNLGYLPGGDKSITTLCSTTLESLQSALKCLAPQGAISLTCYPGHPEGLKEYRMLLPFLASLPSSQWEICHHEWINRPLSPTWIWIKSLLVTKPHA